MQLPACPDGASHTCIASTSLSSRGLMELLLSVLEAWSCVVRASLAAVVPICLVVLPLAHTGSMIPLLVSAALAAPLITPHALLVPTQEHRRAGRRPLQQPLVPGGPAQARAAPACLQAAGCSLQGAPRHRRQGYRCAPGCMDLPLAEKHGTLISSPC